MRESSLRQSPLSEVLRRGFLKPRRSYEQSMLLDAV